MHRLALLLLLTSTTLLGQSRFDAVVDLVEKNYRQPIDHGTLEERALRAFLKDLDPYSNYLNAVEWADFQASLKSEFGGIGVILGYDEKAKLPYVNQLMYDGPAVAAGIRRGDVLLEIDGHRLEGLTLDDVIPILRGMVGTPVRIVLRRGGANERVQFSLVRAAIPTPSVRGVNRDERGRRQYVLDAAKRIGYVRVMRLADDTVPELRRALDALGREHIRGIVLDLRDSAGGKLRAAVGAADLFLDGGRLVTVVSRVDGDEFYDADPDVLTRVPVIMLINEWTASSSEILAGALADNHRVLTMGQRTYGKGRVQVTYSLPEGQGGIVLSTGTFQRPNGRTIDKHDAKSPDEAGITPDPGLEFPLDEKESKEWAEEIARLDGAAILTPEEQVFRVPDRELACAVEVLQGEIARNSHPSP
jgi:carboxyl-terminal processing protease